MYAVPRMWILKLLKYINFVRSVLHIPLVWQRLPAIQRVNNIKSHEYIHKVVAI